MKKDKLKFLIEILRQAATTNTLVSKFQSIEIIDDETCLKITGFCILFYILFLFNKPMFEKSSNNAFQRKSWSVHKGRHLVKPFVICATDGEIVDIYGLFEANKNDATILSSILKENIDLRELLTENDIFLLDRGFRDC